jgi:hypothetical protein
MCSLAAPETSLNDSRRWQEMSLNFAGVTSQSCYESFFTCHKILQHGASSFTSHLKEGVLRTFITIKNPLPWPGLNSRPLGPVASTLTTTPRRKLPISGNHSIFLHTGWHGITKSHSSGHIEHITKMHVTPWKIKITSMCGQRSN